MALRFGLLTTFVVAILTGLPILASGQQPPQPAGEELSGGLVLPGMVAGEIEKAQVALDTNNPQRAIEILRPLVELAPDSDEARGLLGIALMMNGDLNEGRALVDALPEHPNSFHTLGRTVSVLEETDIDRAVLAPYRDRAMKLALLAAEQKVDDPTPYLYIATIAARENDIPEMRRATEVLLEKFPNEEQGHFLAALVAGSEGDWATHDAQLAEAERLGMPQDIIEEARTEAARAQAVRQNNQQLKWLIGGGILLLIIALLVYRKATRRNLPPAPSENGPG
ncbi:hypothetical protein CA54_07700 [Symmachiella macrocystis]|uniref:Tetratricopeptide repeat protein n=1 Tax=Symmachiella macrocystis TaxID=2527985 RepID=A0A5C6BIT2_9PLAN|nr:tetratricopeptide repeat protein [Symmachiella macrocystis]TWU11958.1 hypothetical protein CA54_07700 [Symmachiella macrocystis]